MYSREEKADIWLDSLVRDAAKKLRLRALAGSSYALAERFSQLRKQVAEAAGEEGCRTLEASLASGGYVREMLASYARKSIVCVTLSSNNYPAALREIPDPPLVLYCRGDASLLARRKFAIVGSRHTPPAVMKQAERFARELSAHFLVLSGTADGGDTAALRGALAGGAACAVLAHGHDHFVPEGGRRLREEVEAHGVTFSEYPPSTEPRPYYYPARNRLLAGLAEGVLVVSAGQKSGTRITADRAYEYGRGVYAFPHPIGASYGAGCNALIKEYAKLTDNLVDILADFGINLTEAEEISLTPPERTVFEALRAQGEAHVTALAEKSGLPAQDLNAVLMLLQMKGLAAPCGGNRWAALR